MLCRTANTGTKRWPERSQVSGFQSLVAGTSSKPATELTLKVRSTHHPRHALTAPLPCPPRAGQSSCACQSKGPGCVRSLSSSPSPRSGSGVTRRSSSGSGRDLRSSCTFTTTPPPSGSSAWSRPTAVFPERANTQTKILATNTRTNMLAHAHRFPSRE